MSLSAHDKFRGLPLAIKGRLIHDWYHISYPARLRTFPQNTPEIMAILKLYGMSKSTCTRRVATVLHELKVPFELIEVKMVEGENKSPAYLEKQPFGQIPYIVRSLAPLTSPHTHRK
jgi:hypothetical protein